MRKLSTIIAIAAACLLAGCQKEAFEATTSPLQGTTTLKVSLTETKTALGDVENGVRKVYWTSGDVLSVNGVASDELVLDAPAQAATFTFQTALTSPYNIFYPADDIQDASAPSAVTLPVYGNVIPLAGYTEGDNCHVSAVTSAVKITITPGSTYNTVNYVQIEAADGRKMSGAFTIDYQTGTLTATEATTSALDKVVRANVEAELEAEGTSVIIPVPAGEYGIKVKIADAQGHYMTKSTTSAKTFKAGNIVALPSVAFEPTATEIGVTINSADDWNTFAAAYNNGDYDLTRPLIVNFGSDIDFSGKTMTTASSYKDEKYMEYVTINGNGHKISNLAATDVLIGCVGPGSVLKDLTMDETCTFNPAYDGSTQKHFGPFVEYVKGTVENCTNKGNITLSGSGITSTQALYVGGIAGRVREGKITGCANYGKIESESSCTVSGKGVYLGGICGYISNEDGIVENCANHGSIVSGAIAEPNGNGGIIGLNNGTTSHCQNDGSLSNNQVRASGDPSKNVYLGGIAAITGPTGKILNCKHTADISSTSSIKLVYVGGICARANGGTYACDTAKLAISSTAGIRQAIFGGYIGTIESYDTELDMDKCVVDSKTSISGMESGSAVYVYAGGVLGRANNGAKATLKGANIEVPVDITLDESTTNWTAAEVWIGGIVGGTTIGDDWTSFVDISDFKAANTEKDNGIKLAASGSYTFNPVVMGVGGILGGANGGASVKNCTNTNIIMVFNGNTASKKSNGKIVDFGGIAGRITGGDTEISGCTTTSACSTRNYQYNNNDVTSSGGDCTGGIIGSFGHVDGNTSKIVIKDCTSAQKIYAYRGAAGGVGGYLSNATVSNCNYTGIVTNANKCGGLAGVAANSTFSDCSYSNATGLATTNGGSCPNYTGGLAGETTKCAFDGCSASFGVISAAGAAGSGYAPGALIGYSDDATTVGATTPCKAKGTLTATNYTIEDGVTMADGIELTTGNILTYAIGNKGITVTASQLSLISE